MYHNKTLPEWAPNVLLRARLIQGGLMMSVIAYGIVAHFAMSDESGASASTDPEGLEMNLSILGIGACFFASLAHRVLLKPERVMNPRDPDRIAGKVFIAFLMTWALAELCAVCGIILVFLTRDPSLYFTFGALSILTILAHPITEARLKQFG